MTLKDHVIIIIVFSCDNQQSSGETGIPPVSPNMVWLEATKMIGNAQSSLERKKSLFTKHLQENTLQMEKGPTVIQGERTVF